MRTSSVNTDFWDSKKDGTKVILRRVLVPLGNGPVPCAEFVRLLTPQRMAALRRQLPIDSLSPANGNTLNDILADPISRKHLFPEGIIVRDGEVFNAHESNTFLIIQRCTAMLVSGSASSTYTSLSFGYAVTCALGRLYHIEYYGMKNDSMILAHVSRHLPLAPEISREQPVVFSLYVPEACMGEESKRRFHEFAVENIAPGRPPPRCLTMYSMTHPLPLPNPKL
ncbi:hypothetical protein LSAT2_009577 [Lamellibrachia satsuma]|nr:hypothetical protein LSAT2_009577 [Lamellibrachia satsuma]